MAWRSWCCWACVCPCTAPSRACSRKWRRLRSPRRTFAVCVLSPRDLLANECLCRSSVSKIRKHHSLVDEGRLPMAMLPSKFAVDYVTPRQNQAHRGTCWDFATIGFLEQTYRENGVKNGWLAEDEYVAFSEQVRLAVAWFVVILQFIADWIGFYCNSSGVRRGDHGALHWPSRLATADQLSCRRRHGKLTSSLFSLVLLLSCSRTC